jgi:pimeloyl-ACP methyl ester carboxylesterase
MAPVRAEAFSAIGARCLLLHGTQTRCALREIAERLARRHPHWQAEALDGCGHMAPLMQAERVNRRLVEFLAEAPATAPA